jgi:hypothetical protein
MHADETRVEREKVRLALIEAQAAQDAATDDAQRLDCSKRIVMLAQRYRLLGADLNTLPGHEGKRWK